VEALPLCRGALQRWCPVANNQATRTDHCGAGFGGAALFCAAGRGSQFELHLSPLTAGALQRGWKHQRAMWSVVGSVMDGCSMRQRPDAARTASYRLDGREVRTLRLMQSAGAGVQVQVECRYGAGGGAGATGAASCMLRRDPIHTACCPSLRFWGPLSAPGAVCVPGTQKVAQCVRPKGCTA
jgi:hypothetical protein